MVNDENSIYHREYVCVRDPLTDEPTDMGILIESILDKYKKNHPKIKGKQDIVETLLFLSKNGLTEKDVGDFLNLDGSGLNATRRLIKPGLLDVCLELRKNPEPIINTEKEVIIEESNNTSTKILEQICDNPGFQIEVTSKLIKSLELLGYSTRNKPKYLIKKLTKYLENTICSEDPNLLQEFHDCMILPKDVNKKILYMPLIEFKGKKQDNRSNEVYLRQLALILSIANAKDKTLSQSKMYNFMEICGINRKNFSKSKTTTDIKQMNLVELIPETYIYKIPKRFLQ